MRGLAWISWLWPGLPWAWYRGDPAGLLAAAGFAALASVLLAATCVWPELAPPSWRAAGWAAAAGFWCAGAWRAARQWPRWRDAADPAAEDLFIQAQTEYLKGHWFEAETLLRRLVQGQRDLQAELLLAGVYRRTGRWAAARRALRRAEQLDEAPRWRLELDQERRRLAAAAKTNAA